MWVQFFLSTSVSYRSLQWVVFVRTAGCPSFRLAVEGILTLGHCTQTFQLKFFIPAMLIGIIGFYHFTPLSLTLAGGVGGVCVCGGGGGGGGRGRWLGYKLISAKQNLLASSSRTLFIWSGWNLMRCFSRNIAVDLDEIQYVATTCWFVEAHAKFILHQ